MSRHWNGDIWGALAFSAAIAVVVLLLIFLTGCVQPYPAESKSMGTQPICVFLCFATVSAVEDNAGSPTTTVGSSATGGGRSRSTVIESSAPTENLYD